MTKKYVLDKGKVSFGSLEAKQSYLLRSAIFALDYIGKESKLSSTEKSLKKIAIRQIKQVEKQLRKKQ